MSDIQNHCRIGITAVKMILAILFMAVTASAPELMI